MISFFYHEIFHISEYITKVYLSILNLIEIATDVRHNLLNSPYEEAYDIIYEYFIPDFIQLRRPVKSCLAL